MEIAVKCGEGILVLQSLLRKVYAIQFEKAEFVPITSLCLYKAIFNFKKATAPETFWVFPFQHGPVPFFNYLYRDAVHLRRCGKFSCKHVANGLSSHHRFVGHLMVYCISGIHIFKSAYICIIKSGYPCLYDLFWRQCWKFIYYYSTVL